MEEVGWGLIGCGDIAAKRVASALATAPSSRLVAVSRRRSELAAEFARQSGAARSHATWEELLRDPEVSAVYVATPVHLHAAMTVAAAEAGKHVLCEKPMALDVAECDRMVEAAQANRVRLGVSYYRRFYPILRRVRELLAGGAIGEPVVVHLDAFEAFDVAPDHPRAWLLDRAKSGGGPMFDFGCHRLEVLLSLFGPLADVRSVLARVTLDREVEDTTVASMRFAGGPLATLTVSHAVAEATDSLHVYGRKGSLHVPKLNGAELRVVAGGEERVERHPPPENLHQPLVDQFVRAIQGGEPPAVDGSAGREVNRLLAQVYSVANAR
jgi:predicted dehydrogenase